MVANVDWFVISHRLVIALAAQNAGWKVYVACEDTGRSNEIEIEGIKFINFKFSRSGTNPFIELKTLAHFLRLYSIIDPDVVHHITLKPVSYGSMVAKFLGVNGVLNAVSGLGYNFTDDRKSIVSKLMIKIMRFGFSQKNLAVIFQNNDDYEAFTKLGILNEKNEIVRIKGSGVDLETYYESKLPEFNVIKIVLPIRMLWDKGVKELREASDILRHKYKNKIQFILSGLADEDNKAGVPAAYLKEWEDDDYVKWIGYQRDMVSVYQNSHIVVLPSYREGMPKTLIEACAIGRAIVTTDAIGCKECVDEGINGYKVPVKDSRKLADALEKLITDPKLIKRMSKSSRRKAEQEFDVKNVIRKHLEVYNSLIRE